MTVTNLETLREFADLIEETENISEVSISISLPKDVLDKIEYEVYGLMSMEQIHKINIYDPSEIYVIQIGRVKIYLKEKVIDPNLN